MLIISAAIAGFALMLDRLSPPDAERVRRILAQARISRIADVRDDNHAVVRGTVAVCDGNVLVSPLTVQRCVAWLVVFDEVGAKDWVELGRAQDGVPFLLRSADGTARVIPEPAMLATKATLYERPMPPQLYARNAIVRGNIEIPDRITELARRVCRPPNHMTTTLRATEYAVFVDATITVGGHVARETDPDAAAEVTGYRNALPTRPVLSGARRAPLLIA
jgi:hypothetical protein